MDSELAAPSPTGKHLVSGHLSWVQDWRRYIAPAVFLVYLLYAAQSVGQNSHGASMVAGDAILVVFAGCFLGLIRIGPQGSALPFWILYGLFFALFVAELPLARDAAFIMCLYITAITVPRLGIRSAPIVIALSLASLLVPAEVASWHENLRSAWWSITPVAIVVVAIVSVGVKRLFESNYALAQARTELASMAAENERIRIARDLHDLLGHSLTAITVKAGLARRLGEVDHPRALQEIAEVEVLARRSLADVRAAVANYREVTLTGELATGRELLRAAGIIAELPSAIEITDPTRQELFGWAVREGITNVVRHAHARNCTVRLAPSSVEIVDDGIGAPVSQGNGLLGLRERVAAAGGILDAGPVQPRGWRLRVSLPPGALAS